MKKIISISEVFMENKFCSVCGKEKEIKVIPYIDKTMYIDCECETRLKEKIEKEKREKAINAYIKKRIKKSGVLLREENAFFDNLVIDENNKKAIEGAKYITALMLNGNNLQGKNGLILSGNRGSGKTYIATSIINEYNKNEKFNEFVINDIIKAHDNDFVDDLGVKINSRCRFIKEKDVIQLSDKYNYKENTSPMDEFKNAKILVVDDVGSSYGESRKIMSALFDLFDYRYSQQLSTIITTNLSKEELKVYLGERTFDRLRCCCHYIKLTSPESRRS